jgi:putative sterol carrier protein
VTEESMIPPDQFANLIAEASDDQLAEGMATNRDQILDEIFKRWSAEFRAEKARDVDAVVEWQITRPEGGEDRWQITIRDGACSIARDGGEPDPDVTFRVAPVEFVKLIAGVEAGPKLFILGRLKVRGNLMLAARFQGLFNAPSPGASA